MQGMKKRMREIGGQIPGSESPDKIPTMMNGHLEARPAGRVWGDSCGTRATLGTIVFSVRTVAEAPFYILAETTGRAAS